MGSGAAYDSGFAQEYAPARSTINVSRNRFKQTADLFMSFSSPTTESLAWNANFPCENALRQWESILRLSHFDAVKIEMLFDSKTCILPSNAVKKIGSLVKKVTLVRISTVLDLSNFFSKLYFSQTAWKPQTFILTVLSSLNLEPSKNLQMHPPIKSSH